MILLAIFLTGVGLLMAFKPGLIWRISEKWKSTDATEPSNLYVLSIRVGGAFCTLAGVAAIVVYLVGPN